VTTSIEVIDTAVKIGLGSLITLAGTYVITRLNHDHENSREKRKRYFDALESVGADVEEVTHVALRYWALVVEWARNNKQSLGLTEKRQKELDNTKSELFDQFKNLTVAESKLLLLGLTEQADLLRHYGEFLKRMRRQHYDGKDGLSEQSMEHVREELLTKRAALFGSLSEAYHSDS